MHANLIFDVLNQAGSQGLNIIYLFGHNHSSGWDDYLGGSAVYLKKGDSINIAQGSTTKFQAETLNFTYMNAGYTGYYMNCGPGEYSSDPESRYRAADETLTCSVIEIYGDRIEIARYDENGQHDTGSSGEADPYNGGIDDGLIGPEYYSRAEADRAETFALYVFRNTENLENAYQFLTPCIGNFDNATALAFHSNIHLCAEILRKLAAYAGVGFRQLGLFLRRSDGGVEQIAHQLLTLAHCEGASGNALSCQQLLVGFLKLQQYLGVANGNLQIFKHFSYGWNQVEKANHVGNHSAGFAYMLGDGLLLHAEFLLEQAVLLGFFQRGKVGALQVFNESKLGHLLVCGFMHHNLHRGLAQFCNSSQSPFAGYEFEGPIHLADNQRLNQPSFLDGGCQFLNLLFIKVTTRLERGGFDIADFCTDDTVTLSDNIHGRACAFLFFHNEGTQPFS
jgi:hypothetical protein